MGVDRRACLELGTAMVLVGSVVFVNARIATTMPVFPALALRMLVSSALLIPWLLAAEGRLPRPGRTILLQALVGVVLANVCLLYGLRRVSTVDAGILTSLTPAMIAVLASRVLYEPISRRQSLGIGAAVLGILLVQLAGQGGDEAAPVGRTLGVALVTLSVVGEALFTIFGRVSLRRMSPIAVATSVSSIACVPLLAVALCTGPGIDAFQVPPGTWPSLLYVSVASTGAFLLWSRGLSRVTANAAAGFVAISPVTVILLSSAWNGVAPTPLHLAGLVCVLASIPGIARGNASSD